MTLGTVSDFLFSLSKNVTRLKLNLLLTFSDSDLMTDALSHGVANMTTNDEDTPMKDSDFESSDEEEDDGEESSAACRKRKPESRPKTPPTSPTGSPSKRPRRGRTMSGPPKPKESPAILDIMEKKKKGVRHHGLLQFVLWRESIKAGKDLVSQRRQST
jgi:hypothetical protein